MFTLYEVGNLYNNKDSIITVKQWILEPLKTRQPLDKPHALIDFHTELESPVYILSSKLETFKCITNWLMVTDTHKKKI